MTNDMMNDVMNDVMNEIPLLISEMTSLANRCIDAFCILLALYGILGLFWSWKCKKLEKRLERISSQVLRVEKRGDE